MWGYVWKGARRQDYGNLWAWAEKGESIWSRVSCESWPATLMYMYITNQVHIYKIRRTGWTNCHRRSVTVRVADYCASCYSSFYSFSSIDAIVIAIAIVNLVLWFLFYFSFQSIFYSYTILTLSSSVSKSWNKFLNILFTFSFHLQSIICFYIRKKISRFFFPTHLYI